MKLTDNTIKNLKPKDKKYFIHGDMSNNRHGFAICVYPKSAKSPNGTKSWFFIYRINGKRCFLPLGKYPTMSLAEAARKFDEHWAVFISGKNPADVQNENELERIKAPTVKELCSEYMEKHAKRFKKSWKEDDRILNREVIPTWGKRKAADIVKRDVHLLLESIIERGSAGIANNIFQVIRKMFNFAVERDIISHSPCFGVKLPTPKKSRDRVLSEYEIEAFWNNLPNCAMTNEIRNALKLILVTAQRPGEVIQIHTNEIDGKWWTIPAERSKNGKSHRVPLSELAMEIIQQAIEHIRTLRETPIEIDYSGFIFPSPHTMKIVSIERHALAVATIRNLAWPLSDDKRKPILGPDGKQLAENRFKIEHFTPHDLRRTAATFLAKAGEMDEVIDAVLNHAKQGVIKVYNQYRYDKEKLLALDKWSVKLTKIVTNATEI
jgi:integrase